MKSVLSTLLCCTLLFSTYTAHAQCSTGEVEVSITVRTDGYGYEAYWQLIPAANNCGTGTIFAGGNTTVGCGGGGERTQTPGGYGDFQVINEGPWCLTEGAQYSIYLVDDWGDGGTSFDVTISGYPVHQYRGVSTNERFTFTAVNPPARDAAVTQITTSGFVAFSAISIEGYVKNTGTNNITSFDISYSADGGTPVTQTISGVNITPFASHFFTHPTPWTPTTSGAVQMLVQVSNVNGQGPDAAAANDTLSKTITVKTPIPNIMDWYTEPGNNMTFETVATSADEVRTPRDLDFAPSGELWIVNKESEQTGGTTVTFFNPGQPNQTAEFLQDGNAWHFMSLPTAIAFSNNGNFATSPGVFDANHDGGSPFTGPALWSSDMDIYAQPSGGNGSHLDMLHESPESMGIASESDNKFWLFDSYSNDIVYYDFQADHGPGADDHSDGIIRRYTGMYVDRINEHIVCHLVYDLNSGWLYFVDGGHKRILRLDTKSGVPGGTPSFAATEPLAEYVNIDSATWQTVVDSTAGLVQPAGIDLIGNHLIVSDYSNGDILIYDVTSIPATEVTRLSTGSPGVMGVVVGPDGRIWYVNAENNTVMRIEPDSVAVDTTDTTNVGLIESTIREMKAYPVPADDVITIQCNNCDDGSYQLTVFNILGEEVVNRTFTNKRMTLDISHLNPGIYTAMLRGSGGGYLRKIVVE